jgi:hypothetical protein
MLCPVERPACTSVNVSQSCAGVADYADEESSSRLCDSGLPDPDVCDVLHIPPRETQVFSEAWSRG